MTDEYIQELTKRVSEFEPSLVPKSSEPLIKLNKYTHIGIPMVITILLFYFQPEFVKVEDLETGEMELKYSKIILWTIVLSSALIIGIYGYNYKK